MHWNFSNLGSALHELEAPRMLGQKAPSMLPDLSSDANSNHDGRKRSKRPASRTGQRHYEHVAIQGA
jgi:hypothetical protein